jgi:hypothetical protein
MNPHMNLIKPPMTAKNVYNSIFVDQINPSHDEAMRQLFLDSQGEWVRRRASQRA